MAHSQNILVIEIGLSNIHVQFEIPDPVLRTILIVFNV